MGDWGGKQAEGIQLQCYAKKSLPFLFYSFSPVFFDGFGELGRYLKTSKKFFFNLFIFTSKQVAG